MTYEELKALPILDSVIRETLRIHPPIHSIMRKVISDIPVPPTLAAPSSNSKSTNGNATYVVPKGHFVLSSPAVSQMDPRVWKDPETFAPARWSDPEGVAAQAYKSYADENGEKVDYGFGAVSKGTESPYQPFGAGRHRCIGEQFAYVQIGTIIATLVRRMELRMETPFPEHNYHVSSLCIHCFPISSAHSCPHRPWSRSPKSLGRFATVVDALIDAFQQLACWDTLLSCHILWKGSSYLS